MRLIPRKKKYAILFLVTTLVLVLDQYTKYLTISHFRLGETLPIIPGFFDLTYVRNTGAAFGVLAEAHPAFRVPFFLMVPLVALVAIWMIFRRLPNNNVVLAVALSLVIGGAIGNLIDRVCYGYVIDFLLFHWKYEYQFPAFNVADSAICVGVGILMLDLLLGRGAEEGPSASTSV